MTIEFKPGRYIHGIWFAGNGRMDVMGCLWREEGDWVFDYRFRYYAGPDPHDENDRKSWYRVEIKREVPEDEVAGKMTTVMNLAAGSMPGGSAKAEFCPFRCDGADPSVPHLFRAMPWMHSRKPTPEEEKRWSKEMGDKK